MTDQKAPRPMNEHESRFYRTTLWAETVKTIVTQACKWSAIAWCAYQARLVLVEQPGFWEAELDVRLDPYSLTVLAALAVVGFALAYAWRQRRLRLDTIRHLGSRSERLEKRLDPERSSSGLSSSGEAPEEDDR